MPTKEEIIIKPSDLIKKASTYLDDSEILQLKDTIKFSTNAHIKQKRLSGVDYITHPLAVAFSLTELKMDIQAIQASLLHDTLEDCGIKPNEIENLFGPEVTSLVEAVTKISSIELTNMNEITPESETMKKMFLAMAEDVRVVIIKIADRLHNMQTLQFLSKKRQIEISKETMEVFAPLADRLGMWQYKWQLEDLAFSYLEPSIYKQIDSMIASSHPNHLSYIDNIVGVIEKELQSHKIVVEAQGRVKHVYSIYKKMQRYASEGKKISEIYDLFAIRIIVNSIPDCYLSLGIIHQAWRPIPGAFDDYIANSKDSLYQSIHTTVIGPDNKPLEVQIRTRDMHERAEIGVAAHWKYKDQHIDNLDPKFEKRLVWLRGILERQIEATDTDEFIESLKHDLFQDQVFVYTPNNDLKMLPSGSTPVDFAFSVHTDLGFYCKEAKVNGSLVSLKYPLQNGDIVEILRSNKKTGPPREWLNESAGFLGANSSKQKVKQWFRKFEKEHNINKGKEFLSRELSRLKINRRPKDFTNLMGFNDLNDLYAAIGYGDVSNKKIVQKIFENANEFLSLNNAIRIKLTAIDRVGLLRDITTVISSSGVNMMEVSTDKHNDDKVSIFVTLETNSGKEFANLFYDLDVINDVITLERVSRT